jgi:hypothetical protein
MMPRLYTVLGAMAFVLLVAALELVRQLIASVRRRPLRRAETIVARTSWALAGVILCC